MGEILSCYGVMAMAASTARYFPNDRTGEVASYLC